MMQRVFQLSCVSLCLLTTSLMLCDSVANGSPSVEMPDDANMLYNRDWANPAIKSDPAFRDAVVGLNHASMSYTISVTSGSSYVVALGFCEGFWDKLGQRLIDISIDGKHRATTDTIADAGHNIPYVVKLPVTDTDGDGKIRIEICAAEKSPDVNSILNVIWVFAKTDVNQIDNSALIQGDLNNQAYIYLPVGRKSTDSKDAHFQVMGKRCVAYLNPEYNVAGSIAFSITESLASLQVHLGDSTITDTKICDNWLERSYQLSSGAKARSSWFTSVDKPAFIVLFEIYNPTDKTLHTKLSARLRPNPGYFNKFVVQANDTSKSKDGIVTAADSSFPQLKVCAGIFPSPENTNITGGDVDTPGAVSVVMERDITLPPGKTTTCNLIVVGGDERDHDCKDLVVFIKSIAANTKSELNLLKKTVNHWNDDRLVIQTPDDQINRYFEKTKQWAFKDTRILPFGKPYDLKDSNLNERIPVLTASPVYHGVFANDNIQSIWEWGALGSEFYPILENSLDVMSGYGIPESVEWMAGDGSIFLSALKIGQHAEWVTGACSLILWSGCKEYQIKYWPKVKDILSRYQTDFDRDHDYLDDYSSSPFPEHPNPETYNHEMLYASAFWYKAFQSASTAAEMIGDAADAHDYADTALSIRKAINAKFGSSWGYAGWLDSQHNQHEHINHNSVLPLEYGISTDYYTEKVLKSIFSQESMTEWGPLHMDSKHGIEGSQLVWAFQRWNLVHALFETDRADQALNLMRKWINQESGNDILYGAPEAYKPEGKITSLGYSWTAGRAVRACLFGLYGFELLPDGFAIHPRMPSGWTHMSLHKLEIRGTLFDIDIKKADTPRVTIDNQELAESIISSKWFDGKHHNIIIECAN